MVAPKKGDNFLILYSGMTKKASPRRHLKIWLSGSRDGVLTYTEDMVHRLGRKP